MEPNFSLSALILCSIQIQGSFRKDFQTPENIEMEKIKKIQIEISKLNDVVKPGFSGGFQCVTVQLPLWCEACTTFRVVDDAVVKVVVGGRGGNVNSHIGRRR